MRERHFIWHAFASFCVTPRMQSAILTYFETPEAALFAKWAEWETFFSVAEKSGWKDAFGFKDTEKVRIKEVLGRNHEKEYESLAENGIGFVTEEDANYPEKFRKLFEPPRCFYYKGSAPKELPMVAVIGARKCSNYGSATAYRIARQLAEQGVGVVSGLAYGVDKAAHDGALAGRGITYAVLGCGVDVCYPKSHRATYEQIIASGGCVISEYPPGTQPLSCLFPQRNRIIAGLSDGILVTEARKKSGTLITVSYGLEYGKNIYAVPGRIDDVLSEGCNYLLKEGAKPVCTAEDIIEDFPAACTKKGKETQGEKCINYNFLKNVLATNEKMVYASLRLKPKHIEEIQEDTKLSAAELAKVLQSLCSYGCIKRYGQAYYALSEG